MLLRVIVDNRPNYAIFLVIIFVYPHQIGYILTNGYGFKERLLKLMNINGCGVL